MGLMLGIYTAPLEQGGQLLLDATPWCTACTIAGGPHGDESLSATLVQPFLAAWTHYADARARTVVVRDGNKAVWAGRLDDPAIAQDAAGSQLVLGALGASVALSDIPYTALWSTTDYAAWSVVLETDTANRAPKQYNLDQQGRLFLGLKKNSVYRNANDAGGFYVQIPDGSSRVIVGLSFDWEINLPTNWTLRLFGRGAGFTGGASLVSLASAGSLVSGSTMIWLPISGYALMEFFIRNDTGASSTWTGEDGAAYARIANLRVVTSLTNFVNTTFTAARAAGTSVTATVVSTARMYAGLRLVLNSSSLVNSESVVVESVTDATHFVATFAKAHASGETVQGHVVYADEIVGDMLSAVRAANPGQLDSSVLNIQSPQIDLTDEAFADADIPDALNRYATIADNQTPPRAWEWGVDRDRKLFFRPQSTGARTWYVDVADLSVERSIGAAFTSVYAVYADAYNRTVRTAAAVAANVQAQLGITRRAAVQAQTTNATIAALQRDAALDDMKQPAPRMRLSVRRLSDAAGASVPLWLPQAGDTIVIRNLPPIIGAGVDGLRVFRLARRTVDLVASTLDLEPSTPAASLDHLLALLALSSGIYVGPRASQSATVQPSHRQDIFSRNTVR